MQDDLDLTEQVMVATKRWLFHIAQHLIMLFHSNTMWIALAWMAVEAGRVLDPTWLAAHPVIKTWIGPAIAAGAVMVKIMQNRNVPAWQRPWQK